MSDYNFNDGMRMHAPGASTGMMSAPGIGSGGYGLQLPGAMEPATFPGVDDRAVEPETGTEMVHGEVRRVLPANPPHADRHTDIAYVLRAHVARGWVVATDLLTRVDDESDFATDVCVRKEGVDRATGTRYLEELAFEVKDTQQEAELLDRVRRMTRRGVRRIFAIHVKKDPRGVVKAGPVKEWLPSEDAWMELHPTAQIEDPCLARPVKVKALLDGAEAEYQVTWALLARGDANRAVAQYKQTLLAAQKQHLDKAHRAERDKLLRAHREDKRLALEAREREGIIELCEVLGIELGARERAHLDAMTGPELAALRQAIRTGRCWPAGQP